MDPSVAIHKIGDTLIGITEIIPGDESHRVCERAAVARVLAEIAPGIPLSHLPTGAPAIPGAYISISHSHRLAVAAINKYKPIGVDAEEWRSALERVKTRFLSPEELEYCEDLLLAWTIKEAVYKAAAHNNLASSQILIAPDMQSATALGVSYSIAIMTVGPTMITLAL